MSRYGEKVITGDMERQPERGYSRFRIQYGDMGFRIIQE